MHDCKTNDNGGCCVAALSGVWKYQARALRSIVVAMVACLSLPAAASSLQDLVGVWILQPSSPPGLVMPDTITFTQAGRELKGVHESLGPDGKAHVTPLRSIKVNGDTVSFGEGEKTSDEHWKGIFSNENELRITLLELSWSQTLRRPSPQELASLKSEIPTDLYFSKLPLPQLRDLPSNGLAQTPPMGWSSWFRFTNTIDENTVRQTADALVSSGLREAGYTLVEIDDGWQGRRDDKGILHPNSKFSDMKALGDYIHSKGLKFGIYTSAGPVTCAGYVGSHGYETEDAQTFASWGVDFLMNDVCSALEIYKTLPELRAIHQKMAEALRTAGRPVIYKIHDPDNMVDFVKFYAGERVNFSGSHGLENWARRAGANLWRTGADLGTYASPWWASISERFERHGKPEDARPGGWNDEDNLLVGLSVPIPSVRPLTIDESRATMTLWSMLASPLILGADVRSLSPEFKSLLMNKEVIAVDQDPLCKQGRRVVKRGTNEVWVKQLSDDAVAVALFNRGEKAAAVEVKWADLGLAHAQQIRDLWNQRDLGRIDGSYSATVPTHGAVLLKVVTVQ